MGKKQNIKDERFLYAGMNNFLLFSSDKSKTALINNATLLGLLRKGVPLLQLDEEWSNQYDTFQVSDPKGDSMFAGWGLTMEPNPVFWFSQEKEPVSVDWTKHLHPRPEALKIRPNKWKLYRDFFNGVRSKRMMRGVSNVYRFYGLNPNSVMCFRTDTKEMEVIHWKRATEMLRKREAFPVYDSGNKKKIIPVMIQVPAKKPVVKLVRHPKPVPPVPEKIRVLSREESLQRRSKLGHIVPKPGNAPLVPVERRMVSDLRKLRSAMRKNLIWNTSKRKARKILKPFNEVISLSTKKDKPPGFPARLESLWSRFF
jgi:hypothetical protein